MQFVAKQPIAASQERVEAAFSDPRFYPTLGDLPGIAPPEVLECRVDSERPALVHLRVRYAFNADLPPLARQVLDPAKLTWVDVSTLDRSAHAMAFRFEPDHYADRFRCQGRNRFEAAPDNTTLQVMEGEFNVSYPLVGGLVERAMITGLRQRLAQEAEIVARWPDHSGPRSAP